VEQRLAELVNHLAIDRRGRARRHPVGTLKTRLSRAMSAAGLDGVHLSLSLSDDDELHALNRTYAGEDHPTDVLSFAQAEGPVVPHGDRQPLGDIVISVEYARRHVGSPPTGRASGRKGRHAKQGLPAELFHLAVHGLVHLLGYDHRDAAEERVMFGYEARLRAAALAPGPVRVARRPPGARAARPSRR